MTLDALLPDDLVWTSDRHLSEVGLTAFADAQLELLSSEAMAHLEACAACAAKLGRAALRALDVGDALRVRTAQALARRDAAPVVPRRRPLPVAAMAVGLALAAAGMIPGLVEARQRGGDDGAGTIKLVGRGIAQVAVLLFRGAWERSNADVAAQWIVAGLLVAVGVVVAARARRAADGGGS
ncbi:MAG TPA: hypothetical protein VGM56_24115 [Byssovorax sp.]|jgi:hypothetical protein